MSEFNIGNQIVEIKTGDEGTVIGFGSCYDLHVEWTTGQCAGQKLYIDPIKCTLRSDQSFTIESCIEFLTKRGFSVTLTKG